MSDEVRRYDQNSPCEKYRQQLALAHIYYSAAVRKLLNCGSNQLCINMMRPDVRATRMHVIAAQAELEKCHVLNG